MSRFGSIIITTPAHGETPKHGQMRRVPVSRLQFGTITPFYQHLGYDFAAGFIRSSQADAWVIDCLRKQRATVTLEMHGGADPDLDALWFGVNRYLDERSL